MSVSHASQQASTSMQEISMRWRILLWNEIGGDGLPLSKQEMRRKKLKSLEEDKIVALTMRRLFR